MITNDRLLTIAIHTYDKALELKKLLEHEGIDVVLHNVNLSEPSVSSGVRVRIKELDLPLALRIIENSEIFILPDENEHSTQQPVVLVPIDFSSYSIQACALAFDIAKRHNARITLLHAYVPPTRINIQFSASLDFSNDSTNGSNSERGDALMDDELYCTALQRLDEFSTSLKEMIKSGELPPVVFNSEVMAEVPEDAILDKAKTLKPMIIVMGTRGAEKKERELIGSVTAEVLDQCRQPVFTIPEQSNLKSIDNIRNVVLISNLDQTDMLALDAITRTTLDNALNIHIVHIAGKRFRGIASSAEQSALLDYCREHYPTCTFTMHSLETDKGIDYLKNLDSDSVSGVSLIVVPNKRTNILTRLFNPSLAHKLLFHADIPLMAIPV